MRKLLLLGLVATSVMIMAACGSNTDESSNSGTKEKTTTEKTTKEKDTDDVKVSKKESINARITFPTQDYDDEVIAEIPYIECDGESSEIDSLNRLINQGIGMIYNNFLNDYVAGDGSIEIRSYPMTNDRYIQVVLTYNTYPCYGTAGSIYSYNYDRDNDEVVTLEMALDKTGMRQANFKSDVESLFMPDNVNNYVGDVQVTGFYTAINGNGEEVTYFLLEVEVCNDEADPWTYFYEYSPDLNYLRQLGTGYMFDKYDLDEMTPPLSYAR